MLFKKTAGLKKTATIFLLNDIFKKSHNQIFYANVNLTTLCIKYLILIINYNIIFSDIFLIAEFF